jgi:hypothetical protein
MQNACKLKCIYNHWDLNWDKWMEILKVKCNFLSKYRLPVKQRMNPATKNWEKDRGSSKQALFFPYVCLVPAGLFCHTCFNLCSLLKETSSWFCLYSCCFGEKFPTAEFWNDIGRNFLLGNRKKIAKWLMRTFTCRSTFLYGFTENASDFKGSI